MWYSIVAAKKITKKNIGKKYLKKQLSKCSNLLFFLPHSTMVQLDKGKQINGAKEERAKQVEHIAEECQAGRFV